MQHRATGRVARLAAMSLVAALTAWAPAHGGEAADEAARAVVGDLVGEAHAAMAGEAGANDEDARLAELERVIERAFAFDVWERFLLGDHAFEPEQRARFRALLPGFLARLYAAQFGKGLDDAPRLVGSRAVRGDVLVEARIPRADGPPLPVAYRVRAFEGRGPLVIDVMVAGVSFLMLKRDEFGALIERDGVEGLLAFMRG
ncbi:MAG TPA: ABC transporter substrate-binding protein [Thermohalobaculum sp.]|nr:ABC transporter substrate-binding protein [Thermohalobaculum sp.]